MAHSLAEIMARADRFVLIGDSSEDRFPGFSYHAYTTVGKRFYCLDLGGLTASRGPTRGGPVYSRVADLPADRDDLAIVWMKPRSAIRGVEVAHEAGCKRIWFSFGAGYPTAVARARELGMEIVEIGRCPVYYLDRKPAACRGHTAMVKLTGLYRRLPQVDAEAKRREMW